VWSGEGVSLLGAATTSILLPLLAVTHFHAGPGWMGLLTAAAWLPWLLIGLHAGAWLDRLDPRAVMITADLVSAATLANAPLAGGWASSCCRSCWSWRCWAEPPRCSSAPRAFVVSPYTDVIRQRDVAGAPLLSRRRAVGWSRPVSSLASWLSTLGRTRPTDPALTWGTSTV
jgi:hypothetical protein